MEQLAAQNTGKTLSLFSKKQTHGGNYRLRTNQRTTKNTSGTRQEHTRTARGKQTKQQRLREQHRLKYKLN